MKAKTDYATTNIRLRRKTWLGLKLRSAQEGKSMAQLIRDAVESVYGERKKKGQSPKNSGFYKLLGSVASGIKDGAEHHDRDIYGVK